jgi:aminoglycoside 3-N-acetyltransferase
MTMSTIVKKTKYNPLILHINPIGLLRIGDNNESRFEKFNTILNNIQNAGGNIAIPTFSYSYAQNKLYDMINTPSNLDEVGEYLRKKNVKKRTIDPNFSYLLFGNNFSNRHFDITNCSSFGNDSLIDDVFLKDGYLGAVGGALEYLTEIHFIEKKLEVDYRFDKKFKGVTISNSGKRKQTTTTFFCRDLNLNYTVSLVQLKQDLIKEKLIEKWIIDDFNLKIEVVKFKVIYDFIKEKIIDNPKYLWSRTNNE